LVRWIFFVQKCISYFQFSKASPFLVIVRLSNFPIIEWKYILNLLIADKSFQSNEVLPKYIQVNDQIGLFNFSSVFTYIWLCFDSKNLVGHIAFVELLRIGKGKQYLTGLSGDSVKSTQAVPVRIKILVGKSYTIFTPSEIISFLTFDFILSKIEPGDLFWGVSWTRLLEIQNR